MFWDSQGKQTSKRVQKSPAALKHDACVELLGMSCFNTADDSTQVISGTLVCFPRLSSQAKRETARSLHLSHAQ